MSRIVSVWLRAWPIACLLRGQRSASPVGDLLSNARSKVLDLQTRDADPAAGRKALAKLALWFEGYTVGAFSQARLQVGAKAGHSVEVSLMLDVTGSMAGSKIVDLKAAGCLRSRSRNASLASSCSDFIVSRPRK